MADADTDALLALVAAGGATANRRALLDRYGSPARALAAGRPAWREAGLDAKQSGALDAAAAPGVERARAWLQADPSHHAIGWQDADYPPLLRRIASPPLALFVAGDPAALWRPAVAIVGSRAPTPGGRDNAFAFAAALAQAGLVVASGLAAGVDAAVHRGALSVEGGLTIAVVGTGVDVPYPAGNRELLAQVATRGAVASEHLPGTPPRKAHFPTRNRILAGLSLGTVVVEAALRSGALITARQAADAGREVFALPGSIHNPLARGCHRLLRDGAQLVESPGEVVELLGPLAARLALDLRGHLGVPIPVPAGTGSASAGIARGDSRDHHRLWNAIGHDPTDMDRLVERTGLTPAELSSMLLVMELEGRVACEHGRYSRRH